MAEVIKVHPPSVAVNFELIGKTVTWFNVSTIGVNISASTGPAGAIQAIYNAIQQTSTIIAAGEPTDAVPSIMSFGVEGEFDVADFQTAIQALGTVDSIILSNSTTTAKTLALT